MLGEPTAAALNGKSLPALDEAKDELKAVIDQLKTKAVIGTMATKSALLEQVAGKQVVHLAVYGYTDDQNPLSSFLALSPETNDKGETVSNGLLTAGELRNLNLNTDLVVISAFQAGLHGTAWLAKAGRKSRGC